MPLIDCEVPITSKDHPGLLSAVFYTDLTKCNLNCYQCHNRRGGKYPPLSLEKFERKLQKLNLLGVEMVIISGGEPFYSAKFRPLIPYLRLAKDYGFLVRIDTNGQYPDLMDTILPHVDGFAMDIKIPIYKISGRDWYDPRYKKVLYSTEIVSNHLLDKYRENIKQSIKYLSLLAKYSLTRTVKYPLLDEKDFASIAKFAKDHGLPHYLNPFFKVEENDE